MENFKHLPEPFRIRVIEPVKRTTRAYREEAIIIVLYITSNDIASLKDIRDFYI